MKPLYDDVCFNCGGFLVDQFFYYVDLILEANPLLLDYAPSTYVLCPYCQTGKYWSRRSAR